MDRENTKSLYSIAKSLHTIAELFEKEVNQDRRSCEKITEAIKGTYGVVEELGSGDGWFCIEFVDEDRNAVMNEVRKAVSLFEDMVANAGEVNVAKYVDNLGLVTECGVFVPPYDDDEFWTTENSAMLCLPLPYKSMEEKLGQPEIVNLGSDPATFKGIIEKLRGESDPATFKGIVENLRGE